jgi:hypothetical protein
MRKSVWTRGATTAIALIIGGGLLQSALAQPAAPILPCLGACGVFNTIQPVNQQNPPAFSGNAEGFADFWVNLRILVGADGHVADVAILDRMGPRAFADQLKAWIKTQTFTPPTLDGKPAMRAMQSFSRLQAAQQGGQPAKAGARPEIIAAYNSAGDALKAGRTDDAEATINKALSTPGLTLYEQGALAFVAAPLVLQRGDFVRAYELVRLPTDYHWEELPPQVQLGLARDRVTAAFGRSDAADGMAMLARLQATPNFPANDPLVGDAAAERGVLDRQTMISVAETIPPADAADGLRFFLYRRHFEFGDISGALTGFDLDCREQTLQFKISDGEDWRVPPNLSDCAIFVRGEPGTSFRIREIAD